LHGRSAPAATIYFLPQIRRLRVRYHTLACANPQCRSEVIREAVVDFEEVIEEEEVLLEGEVEVSETRNSVSAHCRKLQLNAVVMIRTRRFPTTKLWTTCAGARYVLTGLYDHREADLWTEMGTFVHATEGEMVCESINTKIPYFNAPIFLENKVRIIKKIHKFCLTITDNDRQGR
jgi:hypothetical protein